MKKMTDTLPENACIVDVFLEAITQAIASAPAAPTARTFTISAPACLSMGL
jgi:hypothetical protein